MSSQNHSSVIVGRGVGATKMMEVLIKEGKLPAHEAFLLTIRFIDTTYCHNCTKSCCIAGLLQSYEKAVELSEKGDLLDFVLRYDPEKIYQIKDLFFELRTTLKKSRQKMDATDTTTAMLSKEESPNGLWTNLICWSSSHTQALARLDQIRRIIGREKYRSLVEEFGDSLKNQE